MTAALCTHPIDVMKVRFQIYNEGKSSKHARVVQTYKNIVATEGRGAFYRGISASLLRQATFSGSRHGLYGIMMYQAISANNNQAVPIHLGIAIGMTAGVIGALIGNPADLVLVRMQADGKFPVEKRRNYKHCFDGIYRIIREERVSSLWKGCSPNISRGIIVTATEFPVYDSVKRFLLSRNFKDGTLTHVVSGLTTAICASITISPADVVKTRMMNEGLKYSGALDCLRKTWNHEGIFGLYKGVHLILVRSAPHNLIAWVTMERITRYLEHRNRTRKSYFEVKSELKSL